MAKPYIHSLSSVRRYGGAPEDYMPIHEFMDSSKSAIPDNRHRALTHTSWFLSTVLERVFGSTFTNSAGRVVSVRDIGEMHIGEDCRGVIPTAQDYLQEMGFKGWMNNKGVPPSHSKVVESQVVTRTESRWDED